MISFVDLPKNIRVIRVENKPEGVVRTTLGRISKFGLAIEPQLSEQLLPGEREQLDEIIAGYAALDVAEQRYYALALPSVLRKTLDYMEGDATEMERQFIVGAIMDAIRRMRKYQRDGSAA